MTNKQTHKSTKDLQLESLKIPPHSVEAEQAVLGGLMLDNQGWDKVVDRISEEDFYRHDHRLIYGAMSELSRKSQPFDVVTVADSLKANNRLDEVGGDVYLFELANNTPSAANIKAYSDIVRERSILRQLIGVANDISESAFRPEGRESLDILDEAERRVFAISEAKQRGNGAQDIQTLLASAVEKIDTLFHSTEPLTGISTGFVDLDNMTSGLQKSDLVIVAGRPSMGKTMLGVNIAENAALQSKKPVLIFSLEMPGDAIAMRMISSLGRVDQHKVRTGDLSDEDWPRITSAVSMLSEAPIFIDDTPALSPAEMRARARRIAREHGELGMILVDYLQLMQVPGTKENRTTEISEISRNLKALAKELNVPIIALSQLNRSLESRTDKRPVMSDLRESGSLEQDADLVVFIYRDEVYNENSPEKGKAEIIIAKHRNGPIGRVHLTFLGRYTRFDNYSRDNYDVGEFA